MIHLYKKYHVAYRIIGILLIVCMVASMIALMFVSKLWFVPFLVFFPTLILIFVNASVFTMLTSKKLNDEVTTLLLNCQANDYINALKSLFKDKASKGVIVSIYNTFLAMGYVAIDDYDSVYDCCQKITAKNYQTEKCKSMIEYYLAKDQIEQAQQEIEKLKELTGKLKPSKYKEGTETSIKNAEYVIRIKQGNYEGAEEHFLKMLDTIKPLYPLSKASYSYSLGRLLVLKGEPERAKEYLQAAYDVGGDTKYRKKAEEQLAKLSQGL